MAQNMGKDFLKEFVKNTKQYADKTNTDKQDKMLKGLYARSTAYMLVKNSNQGKYGLLMTSLTTQFSMGTSQYPKDVMVAVDILTNHRFNKKEPKNNNQRNKNRNDDNTASTIATQSSFNQEALKKATCYCCGSTLSLFGNPKMVTNIRESKATLELATNAGTRTTKKMVISRGHSKPNRCIREYLDYRSD
jgi:hypothetical protein